MAVKDLPLLSFRREDKKNLGFTAGSQVQPEHPNEITITFADATRNVIVFGGTSSGKTTGVVQPALSQLIERGCPGCVLDVKSEFSEFVSSLVRTDNQVMYVGASKRCSPINIIHGMSEEVFRSFLETETANYRSQDKVWGTGGLRDAMLIFTFYKYGIKEEPSLEDIYKGLKDPAWFCRELWEYVSKSEQIHLSLLEYLDAAKIDRFSILWLGNFRGLPSHKRNDESRDREREQYTWHTNSILAALRPFVMNAMCKHYLCNKSVDQPSFQEALYHDKKIVVLDMPIEHFAGAAYTSARLLRQRIAESIMSFNTREREKLGFGADCFTFMLVDEYQQYINARKYSAHTAGFDDNLWLDKSRAYHHINILSTQGRSSLLAQGDGEAVDSMLQNCRNKVVLSTDDMRTLQWLEYTAGPGASSYVSNPEAFGWCYVQLGISNALNGGKDSECTVTGASQHDFMNRYIGYVSQDVCPSLYQPEAETTLSKNPYCLIENSQVIECIDTAIENSKLEIEPLEAKELDFEDIEQTFGTHNAKLTFIVNGRRDGKPEHNPGAQLESLCLDSCSIALTMDTQYFYSDVSSEDEENTLTKTLHDYCRNNEKYGARFLVIAIENPTSKDLESISQPEVMHLLEKCKDNGVTVLLLSSDEGIADAIKSTKAIRKINCVLDVLFESTEDDYLLGLIDSYDITYEIGKEEVFRTISEAYIRQYYEHKESYQENERLRNKMLTLEIDNFALRRNLGELLSKK